ncbi:MAG: TrkA family potassium uptake protein [Candidatus Limnocylindrales bacterium]
MKIVIVGCGRVGSTLAENLDADGHEVIVFDIRTQAFDRLPETFKGSAIRGDGTDEAVLRRGGADGADIFLSLTEGDNRNIMAAQVAMESLAIAQVIAKINDPVRAAAYAELGVVTLCRTNIMVDSVATYLNLPMQTGPGIDIPQTPGHEHPHPSAVTIESPASPAGIAPDARGPAGAAGRRSVTTNDAEMARAQRLGFRRPRG